MENAGGGGGRKIFSRNSSTRSLHRDATTATQKFSSKKTKAQRRFNGVGALANFSWRINVASNSTSLFNYLKGAQSYIPGVFEMSEPANPWRTRGRGGRKIFS